MCTHTHTCIHTHTCRREREMFYLTTHSTHFIYGYMASDIWLRTILIVRKETCCRHIGYSYRLTARVLLYAPSHRQDNTYHGFCYTSRPHTCIHKHTFSDQPPIHSTDQSIQPGARCSSVVVSTHGSLERSLMTDPFEQIAKLCAQNSVLWNLTGHKQQITTKNKQLME